MSALEFDISLLQEIAGFERRSKERYFSPLLPPASPVVERMTAIPREFTRLDQVAVLKTSGYSHAEIAAVLGIKLNTVNDHSRRINDGGETIVGITVALVEGGTLSPKLLTAGLNQKRKDELTVLQQDTLNLISNKEMWGATDKELAHKAGVPEKVFIGRLGKTCHKLGAKNRFQAAFYGYMCTRGEQTDVIVGRSLEIITLKAQGFTKPAIADQLHMPLYEIKKEMRKLSKGYQSPAHIVIARLEDGVIDQTAVSEGLVLEYYNELTARERDVLSQLFVGRDAGGNRGIANRLGGISEQTVKNYLHNIFQALEVRDRVHAAVFEYLRVKREEEAIAKGQAGSSVVWLRRSFQR